MGNEIFLFFTIIVCSVTSLFAQSQLCPNVPVLRRQPFEIIDYQKWILFRISRNPKFTTITDTTTCSYSYLEMEKCRAVTLQFVENFSYSCTTVENNKCVEKNLRRLVLQSWGEDVNSNLLLIKQELESADDNWEVYRTTSVIARKATTSSPFAKPLQRESEILNFYRNNRIALIHDEDYIRVYQICNSQVPVIIIFVTDDIFNPWFRLYILNQISAYFQNNGLNPNDFVTLSQTTSVNTDYIQGIPRLNVNKTPPVCRPCFPSNIP